MIRKIALAGLLIGIYLAAPALAQVVDPSLPTVVVTAAPEPTLWSVINDTLYTTILALVPAIAAIVAFYVRKFVGDRAAQVVQQMIQAAGERAAAKAIAASKPDAHPPSEANVAVGIEYMKTTMKETLAKAGASDQNIRDIVLANIAKIKTGMDVVKAIAGPQKS